MKHLALFSSLLGAFCLSAPVTGFSRDHHNHHHGGSSHCDSHRSHHSHHSNHSYYCRPSISYRSYPSYYGSYGYNYGSPYGYYPSSYSYYSTPSIGFGYTSPSYSYYRSSRSVDYDDDLAVDVQRALARRGYYRGAIDGDVGPGTRGAIREYQYRNRLEVTGRIDRSLLRALGLS